uniref:Uncharacterized protein n=1 Tax=Moniliophthora roreri TaxID=221103 RepID=A0A0W0FEG9_MONRR
MVTASFCLTDEACSFRNY